MQTIKIDKIYRKVLTAKNGNDYEKVDLYSDGVKYSALDFDGQTKNWQEGHEINVEIKKNGQYLNIELPKMQRAEGRGNYVTQEEFNKALERISKLEALNFSRASMEPTPVDPLSDLPF